VTSPRVPNSAAGSVTIRRSGRSSADAHPEVWEPLREAAAGGNVTLLYSSRDTEHNNAVALREYLMARLAGAGRG
jgi:hypothetical protein